MTSEAIVAPSAVPRGIDVGVTLSTDYFLLRDDLPEADLDHLRRARTFVEEEVLPVIGDLPRRREPGNVPRRDRGTGDAIDRAARLRGAEAALALHTFEGTETIHTLIVGRDITGIGAFA